MTEKKAANVATETAAAVENDFALLMGAGWKRFEQLDAISKAIFQRIQEERSADVQLGLALLQSPTPAEAFILYTKWLSRRTTAFMEEAPKLAGLWTELYAPKATKTPPPLPE
jgi:hypothetical protein